MVEATCTEPGSEKRVCPCGLSETRETAPKGHTVVIDPEKDFTFTEPGLSQGSHCGVCGEILEPQQEITAPVSKLQAMLKAFVESFMTELDETVKEYGPEIADAVEGQINDTSDRVVSFVEDCAQNTISKVESVRDGIHIYDQVEFIWKEDCTAEVVITCSHCGDQWTAGCAVTFQITEEATCTQPGQITYTAKVTLGTVEYTSTKTSDIQAKGHTYGEWTVTEEATETQEGLKTRTCGVCGETETQIIPALGVTPDDGVTPDEDVTPDEGCLKDETCPAYKYTDLDLNAWYHDGVHFCVENGLMVGTGETTFSPEMTTTRAMIVTMLWRMEGKPIVTPTETFDDVADGQWYTDAVNWASAEGIVLGYGDHKFGPGDEITREQLVTMFYRYWQKHNNGEETAPDSLGAEFADSGEVSPWAWEAMCWATHNEIIVGKPGNLLAPGAITTRVETASIIMRVCNKMNG